jgi:general secretion pathway protein J
MSRCAPSGFTLLEILVVLAIFGFLLVGLNQTVRFGLTAWHQEARLADEKTDLEGVDRSLRSIIEHLSPGDDSARPPIVGTADSLTGVTTLRLPGGGPMPAPIEAGLAVSGTRLVLRWRPFHRGVALHPPPPPRETELINGVAHIAIAYWQPSGTWASAWTDAELPLLIRIHLTFAGEGATRWPDIVVAPLLSRR